MKKIMRRCTAVFLCIAMSCIFEANAMASSATEYESREYYTAAGTFVEQIEDVCFRTYRYYATLEQAPGVTIWYNKFVTYTYLDSSRTKILTGPHTDIYESLSPMQL